MKNDASGSRSSDSELKGEGTQIVQILSDAFAQATEISDFVKLMKNSALTTAYQNVEHFAVFLKQNDIDIHHTGSGIDRISEMFPITEMPSDNERCTFLRLRPGKRRRALEAMLVICLCGSNTG